MGMGKPKRRRGASSKGGRNDRVRKRRGDYARPSKMLFESENKASSWKADWGDGGGGGSARGLAASRGEGRGSELGAYIF